MSAFTHSILTDIGWDTLAHALAGGKLTFLHMEAGDGPAATDDAMMGMLELQHKIMDVPITSYSDDGKGQITLIGTLSSKTVETAFWFRELGVRANIDDGDEILYCVANAGTLADYIPDKNDTAVVIQSLEIVVKIDRAANVVVNVSVGANVTAENIGPGTVGAGWFRDKLNNILYFKRFVSTPNVTVSETADTIRADVVFPTFVPIGGIIDYGGVSAPAGYLMCNGQWYNVTQFPELAAVLGARYGGDGVSTFAVPDLRGRMTIGAGQGSGLTNRVLATLGGTETTTLSIAQMPAHSHGATQPWHTHGVYDPTHAHALYDPAHQHSVWDPSHSHGFADPGHAHSVYEPWHYHYGYFSTNSDNSSYPRPGIDSTPQWGYIGGGHDYGVSFGGATICLLTALTSYSPSGIGIYAAGVGCWNWGAYTGTVADWGGTRCGIYGAYTGIYLGWAGGEAISVANTGSGQPHNNMPPFAVVNKIIKF
jgi:microcystin-dependent protein